MILKVEPLKCVKHQLSTNTRPFIDETVLMILFLIDLKFNSRNHSQKTHTMGGLKKIKQIQFYFSHV